MAQPSRIALLQERGSEQLHLGVLLALFLKERGYKVSAWVLSCRTELSAILERVLDSPVYNAHPFFFRSEEVLKEFYHQAFRGSDLLLMLGWLGRREGERGIALEEEALSICRVLRTPVVPVVDGSSSASVTVSVCEALHRALRSEPFPVEGVLFFGLPNPTEYHLVDAGLSRATPWLSLGYLPRSMLLPQPTHAELVSERDFALWRMKLKGASGMLSHKGELFDFALLRAISLRAPEVPRPAQSPLPDPTMEPVKVAVAGGEVFCLGFRENELILRVLGGELIRVNPYSDPFPAEAKAVYLPDGLWYLRGDFPPRGTFWAGLMRAVSQRRLLLAEGSSLGILCRGLRWGGGGASGFGIFGELLAERGPSSDPREDLVELEALSNNPLLLFGWRARGLRGRFSLQESGGVRFEFKGVDRKGGVFQDGLSSGSMLGLACRLNLWSEPEAAKRFLMNASSVR